MWMVVGGWWLMVARQSPGWRLNALNSSTVQGMGSPMLLEMKCQHGYLSWERVWGETGYGIPVFCT